MRISGDGEMNAEAHLSRRRRQIVGAIYISFTITAIQCLEAPAFVRALREAAPGLSRRYFSCQCGSASRAAKATTCRFVIRPQTLAQANARASPFRPRENFSKSTSSVLRSFATSSKRFASQAATGANPSSKQSRFPKSSSNVVAYWLLGSAASVYGIVVFGGLTRLTESGYACL